MWLVNPKILCKNHLLGEHSEIHKHRHNFVKGHKMEGRQGQIQPDLMQLRHDELAEEMLRRGFKHESPYEQPDITNYRHIKVDKEKALSDLLNRCEECKKRLEETTKEDD
jgi:hypothetical protein